MTEGKREGGMCVCVYECEQERGRERERHTKKDRQSERDSNSLTSRIISLNEVTHHYEPTVTSTAHSISTVS